MPSAFVNLLYQTLTAALHTFNVTSCSSDGDDNLNDNDSLAGHVPTLMMTIRIKNNDRLDEKDIIDIHTTKNSNVTENSDDSKEILRKQKKTSQTNLRYFLRIYMKQRSSESLMKTPNIDDRHAE